MNSRRRDPWGSRLEAETEAPGNRGLLFLWATDCRAIGSERSSGLSLVHPGKASLVVVVALACRSPCVRAEVEDLEFVAEHLGEVAMDNRYAALPVWPVDSGAPWQRTAQAGYSNTRTGGLELSGPTLSFALYHRMAEAWSLGAFAFFDDLSFSGRNERRPLEVRFVDDVPLALPADAEFTRLQGQARDVGVGAGVDHSITSGFLAGCRLVAGATWQRLDLEEFSTPYVLLSGASAGASGIVDYSATYDFVSPYLGLSRPIPAARWTIEPRALAVVPLPRQGVQGRIRGPGFDLAGDTADVGEGKHYGDPWLALGVGFRYVPWNLEIDLGSVVSQAILEPVVHRGVDHDVAISLAWQF